MFVITARPELLELRPTWGQSSPTLRLPPLHADEARQLVCALLDSATVPPPIAERVIDVAAGNPLFLEQLLATLVDDGSIVRSNGSWTANRDLSTIPVPSTIAALLAARVDRLPVEERTVLERTSVMGQVFRRAALTELLSQPITTRVDAHLMALTDKEFIERDPSRWDDAFRFRHALIRDAAYAGILKRTRAELHERFADWILRTEGDGSVDAHELRGYHLEQAYSNLLSLGDRDDHVVELGRAASDILRGAAMRARVRGDPRAAAGLIERAVAIRPQSDAEWLELEIERADALWSANQLTQASELLDRVGKESVQRSNRRLEIRSRLLMSWLGTWTGADIDPEELEQEVRGLIDELVGLGDRQGQVPAWGLLGDLHAIAGRIDESGRAAERTAELALSVGDLPAATGNLGHAAKMLARGTTPVRAAIDRCRTFLERATQSRLTEARILASLALLQCAAGDKELAEHTIRQALSIYDELTTTIPDEPLELWGALELIAGDPATAERALRSADLLLERAGEKGLRSTVAAELARALFLQENLEEAVRYADLADELAASNDVLSIGVARGVRGRLLARTGQLAEAEEIVRSAVALMEPSDFLTERGDVLVDLAAVLARRGKRGEAARVLLRAMERYEAKGNVPGAKRVTAALERLQGPR
jgi:tetratricopeptide (TPR) repeat protein